MQDIMQLKRLPRWLAVAVLVAFSGIVLFWLANTPDTPGGKLLAVGYAICHQIVARSFLIDGTPMPLCARCTGIYLGVATGWLLMQIAGRSRAAKVPTLRVSAFLFLALVGMAFDGINSYIHLFPGGTGLYEPHNWLRVTTGIFAGFALFCYVYPVFNAVVWAEPDENQRTLGSLRELAGAAAILVFVLLLVLSERPLFLSILAVASIFGVVFMLTMVGTVLFLSLFRLENTAQGYRALVIPLLAGLTFTFILVGGVDALRYFLTGTWAGLSIGG